MSLTDTAIKKAKPGEKPVKLSDEQVQGNSQRRIPQRGLGQSVFRVQGCGAKRKQGVI
jgi:hypothetical protein